MNYTKFFSHAIQALQAEGRYRNFVHLQKCFNEFPYAWYHQGNARKKVVVWCSNDYLGLGQHPKVLQAMEHALKNFGAGAGGTRNIAGTTTAHAALEKALAGLHDKESALLFTSGYVANETTLCTLASQLPHCVVFSDACNHASMVQGIRNSRAKKIIFQHNDQKDLEAKLQSVDRHRPKIIAFESVYSMQGTIAPIADFCALAKQYHALTYVDEVHGVGLYGAQGAGVAQQQNIMQRVDIIQGTLGKALGLMGGYIAAAREVVDWVRCHAPGFIFTTAMPPVVVQGALQSLQLIKQGKALRANHQQQVTQLKIRLRAQKIKFLDGQSHIIPIIIGDPVLCKQITNRLLNEYDLYVQPINFPTVPRGNECMRLTPTAGHTTAMIDALVAALVNCGLPAIDTSKE